MNFGEVRRGGEEVRWGGGIGEYEGGGRRWREGKQGGGGRESREGERYARRNMTGGGREVGRDGEEDGETHKWSLTKVIKV